MTRNISSVSPKGQVTIPVSIREEFGIEPKDSVAFDVVKGCITVTPLKSRLLEYHQRFSSQLGPLDWKTMREIVREDMALAAAREGLEQEAEDP